MSGAAVLLDEIRAAGAEVGLDDGVLRIRVPKGVLTRTQRERLIDHHADMIRLLAEPANDRYGPDAMRADVQAVFADDSPANHAAAERLAKVTVTDSPVGDDLPAWQNWMRGRYAYRRRCGFSRAEALRIVWREAEWEWHKRHGAVPEPGRCAGCGKRLPAGTGERQIDGAVVHGGDCRAIYDAQYRSAAAVGLMAMGLTRPWL
jgi:hypothetical protein